MKREHIFLVVTGLVFLALAVVFLFFPRPKFSELERRQLKEFPEFSTERLADGTYTADISSWFSDSQPFRDRFLSASMALKDRLALHFGSDEDQISFHEGGDIAQAMQAEPTEEELEKGNREIGQYDNKITAEAESKVAKAGILIVGKAPQARALMNYGGEAKGGGSYARTINEYKKKLHGVNVYCMVVPTSMEFYCPTKARETSKIIKPQLPTIKNIYSLLDDSVKAVDVYTPLGQHASEPIYLRTDHHWSPLGAYYAAEKFASVAKVPFRKLAEYNPHVIHDFVGTMYGYSKDIAIKNSPEDFVYYIPKDTTYTTTYVDIHLDKEHNVKSESVPVKGHYFWSYKDGSSMAYSTFMGGDAKIVSVKTGVKNGRRVAIIKDSFGNAIPSWLFGSFEEVHVIDFRYFPRKITKYVKDNKITDFLFVHNIFNAYTPSVAQKMLDIL